VASMMRWLGASAVGAALMYILDPDRGRRRRALVRDKVTSAANDLTAGADVTARDLANRTRGQVAELRSMARRRPPSDHEIAERIRQRVGAVVSHPRAIDIRADGGRVTLSGPVLADEVGALLATVGATRGVQGIDNRLEVHREPGTVPGLQGAPARRRRLGTLPFMQTVWSPTARLAAGIGGLGAALTGLRGGGVTGSLLALGGIGLLVRGATNLELRRLTGIGAGRRAVTLHKTITVAAPVDQVFQFWSHYENFARFMAHVREVRKTDGDRSHWVVAGPAGVPIEWDTEVTAHVPNEVLAWRTVSGSPVDHAGIVRFDPVPGGTRVDIRMSYNPPAGAIGHAIAALLGRNPKRAMDEDLVRFKSLVEQGKTSAHGQRVDLTELTG
jgi:uncharacterized membrane protein